MNFANAKQLNYETINPKKAAIYCRLSKDVGQSEVVRRKVLKTGLSQKILTQTQVLKYCR